VPETVVGAEGNPWSIHADGADWDPSLPPTSHGGLGGGRTEAPVVDAEADGAAGGVVDGGVDDGAGAVPPEGPQERRVALHAEACGGGEVRGSWLARGWRRNARVDVCRSKRPVCKTKSF